MSRDNYKMYLCTTQGIPIKTLTESLKEVLTDVNIHFSPSGIKIMNMDPNHISLVFLDLHADKFDEYECYGEVPAGVNMMSFHKILKTICTGDVLCMYIKKDMPDHLGIDILNKTKKITNRILYNLLDVDCVEIQMPDVVYDATVTMSSCDFQKYCRELVNFSEHVTFKVGKNKTFQMLIDGTSASQLVSIEESEDSNVVVELNGDAFETSNTITIGKFSLKFLNLFCKSSTLCSNIRLYMKTDVPITIAYSIASLGTVKYCLTSASIEED